MTRRKKVFVCIRSTKGVEMLAEYNNEIFNAQANGDCVNLWKYVPIEGFDKFTTKRGLTYYEKNVSFEEIKRFFSIKFEVCYDERIFTVYSYDGEFLQLIGSDEFYAIENHFIEIERGIWLTQKPISDFSEIIMTTFISTENRKIVESLSIEDFERNWQRYIAGVRP